MENRAHAVVVGIFTLAFGLLLAVVAYWFSGEHTVEDDYLLVSHSSVSGLVEQGEVRYRGVQVGRVQRIEIDPNAARTILIHVRIKRGTPITSATYARLAYQGVTGVSFVQLDDDGKLGAPLRSDKNRLARIDMRPSLLDDVSESGQAVLQRVSDVSLRMSKLLSDQNLARIDHILSNVEAVSSKLDAIPAAASDARLTLKRADSLIADLDGLTKALQQRIGKLDSLAASAERIGKAGEAVSEELLNSTLPKLDRTLDNANRATARLDTWLEDVSSQPQSLLFGKPAPAPGPGEPGFVSP